jgi:hypothetical protein
MGEVAAQPSPRRGVRLEVATSPSPVSVGSEATVNFSVFGPDGKKVEQFESLHTEDMHVIKVSSDLTDFQHLHPRKSANGTLSLRTTFDRPTPYTIRAEFDPKGPVGETTSGAEIVPAGAREIRPDLATEVRTATAAGYRKTVDPENGPHVPGRTAVTLNGGEVSLRAGQASTLTFSLTDPGTGGPVENLRDWLGMPGHAIVFSEDKASFQHLHGHVMENSGGHGGHTPVDTMERGGGHGGHGGHGTAPSPRSPTTKSTDLMFEANFPRAGLYKIWVQFQRDKQVVTADFAVRVQ